MAVAAALRLTDLDNRPMHCDEAVHAVKFGRLLEDGRYAYDPREYHGPSLNYFTLPIARSAAAEELTAVTETHLRLVPAVLGIILVGLAWLVREELGTGEALCAALLSAVSPAMVFYSRYYIQEMILVCFSFGAIVALWRGARCRSTLRRAIWLVVLGACLGMMHASKETFVIPLCAMIAAAILTMTRKVIPFVPKSIVLWGVVIVLAAGSVSALFYSSFLDNPQGVVDSFATYSDYLSRASGEGSAGQHVYPWHHYFRLLFWWDRGDGQVWTEASIAGLALVGLIAGILGKGFKAASVPAVRFLGIYAILLTAVYSALPYKTPWCALGFLHGMILLAGVGAATLVRIMPGRVLKAMVVITVLAALGHLAWQAHRASFVAYEDPNNPYVYAHTTSDVPVLAERLRQIAVSGAEGVSVHVQVICPDDDYWPLPWYLRDFSRVGWFAEMPSGPPAPLIVTQPGMESALLRYLYQDQPPGERYLYVALPADREGGQWRLRPHVPLGVYVRLDLWETHLGRQQ